MLGTTLKHLTLMETIWIDEETLTLLGEIAEAREAENAGHRDSREYSAGNSLPVNSSTATRLAIIGEAAVATWLEIPLDSITWFVKRDKNGNYPKNLKKDADLSYKGRRIEVRNVIDPNNGLAIKRKDVDADTINVKVYVHSEDGKPTGQVDLLTWANARTARYTGSYWPQGDMWFSNTTMPMSALWETRGVAA